MRKQIVAFVVPTLLWPAIGAADVRAQSLGVFTEHSDVGTPSTIGPGSATYDAATKTYTIGGGGENMWAAADHFHYVWKKCRAT